MSASTASVCCAKTYLNPMPPLPPPPSQGRATARCVVAVACGWLWATSSAGGVASHAPTGAKCSHACCAAPPFCTRDTSSALYMRGGKGSAEERGAWGPTAGSEEGEGNDGRALEASEQDELVGVASSDFSSAQGTPPPDVDVTDGGTMGLSGEQLSLIKQMERAQLRRRAGIMPSAGRSVPVRSASPTSRRAESGVAVDRIASGEGGALQQVGETLQHALRQLNEDEDQDDVSSWMSEESAWSEDGGRASALRRHRERRGLQPGHTGAPDAGHANSTLPDEDEARILAALERFATPLRPSDARGRSRHDLAAEPHGLQSGALSAPAAVDAGLGEVQGHGLAQEGADRSEGGGAENRWWERGDDPGLTAFMTNAEFAAQQQQLTKLMQDLAIDDGRGNMTSFLDEEDVAFLADFDQWHRNVSEALQASNEFYHDVSGLAGGDHGAQLEPPHRRSPDEAVSMQRFLRVGGKGYVSVSAAVDVSWPGEVIGVDAGTHPVGDELMFLGLDSECEPIHRHETLVVNDGWSFHLVGDASPSPRSPGCEQREHLPAQIVGSFIFGQQSKGSMACIALTHSGRNVDSDEALPRGEALGGVSLLHVLGSWSFSRCSISFGGGHGVALLCDGSSLVSITASCVGGQDLADEVAASGPRREGGGGLEADEVSTAAKRRHESRAARDANKQALLAAIDDGQEDRCVNAICAINESTLDVCQSQVRHAWNAGVALLDRAKATLNASKICDVGYGVGLNDNASTKIVGCFINTSDSEGQTMLSGALFISDTGRKTSLEVSNTEIHGRMWLGARRPSSLKLRAISGSYWQDAPLEALAADTQAGEQAAGLQLGSPEWREALLAKITENEEEEEADLQLRRLVDEVDAEIRAQATAVPRVVCDAASTLHYQVPPSNLGEG